MVLTPLSKFSYDEFLIKFIVGYIKDSNHEYNARKTLHQFNPILLHLYFSNIDTQKLSDEIQTFTHTWRQGNACVEHMPGIAKYLSLRPHEYIEPPINVRSKLIDDAMGTCFLHFFNS